MTQVLLTGFPGFLGSELVRRILSRKTKPSVVCLVQPKFMSLAKKRLAEIEAEQALAGAGRARGRCPGDDPRRCGRRRTKSTRSRSALTPH